MANTQTVQLHYEETGQGLPVVLLHGFPFDHTIWRAQQAALSDSYRVIAPDLRGYGQSPVTEGVYTMDLLAADVLALLDDLGVERAVWAGHSMGGYVAQAALRAAPGRLAGLALVASHPFADAEDKRMQRQQSADLAEQNGSADVAFSMMGVIFSPSVEGSSPLAQAIYDIMVKTAPAAVAGALRGMAERPDSTETLETMTIPGAVIVGAEDQLIDVAMAEKTAGLMPHGSLTTIPDAGHMLMFEQPEATTEALRAFLKTVD